jgi:hypothetical protein
VGATSEPIGSLGEIFYGGDGIEDDLDYMLCNPAASSIQKWQTSKLLRWVQLLNRLVDLDKMLYGDDNVEGDFDSVLLNPVASTIPKRRMFKLLRSLKF